MARVLECRDGRRVSCPISDCANEIGTGPSPKPENAAQRMVRFKVDTQPGESLQSILVRSACAHVLPKTAPILNAAGLLKFRPGRLQNLDDQSLIRLAQVLRQNPQELLSRSISMESPADAHRVFMAKGLIDLEARWLAPITFSTSQFHQFVWNVKLLPYCPLSGERLVNRCRDCGHRLGWFATTGLGTCEACGCVIGPSTEPKLPDNALSGYRRIAALMSIDRSAQQLALNEISPELRGFSPSKLASAAIALVAVFRSQGGDRRKFTTLDAAAASDIGEIVSSAGDLLVDWQANATNMLQHAADRLAADYGGFRKLWLALKTLADPNKNEANASEIVAAGLPCLAGNMWAARKTESRSYQTQEVVLRLGVHNSKVRKLADEGILKVLQLPSLRRRNVLFEADQVDALRSRIEATQMLTAFATTHELPFYAAEQLAAIGLIEHDGHRAFGVIYGKARVTKESVSEFLKAIRSNTRSGRGPPDLIPLRDGMKAFGGKEKAWGTVLQAIQTGALPCWPSTEPFRLATLMVPMAELRELNNMTFDRSAFQFAFNDKVSQRDAEEILNISPKTLQDANLIQLLEFEKTGKGAYAPLADVMVFARTVVSRSELAARWDVPISKIGRDRRLTGVSRVSFGWNRIELQQKGYLPSA